MGLRNIIDGIDERFITEASETYTIGYEIDGKKKSYNAKANSESDAKRKFDDYMEGNNKKKGDYKVHGVFKGTSDDMDESMIAERGYNDDEDVVQGKVSEDNVTGNLDGGLGQPRIPHAFQQTKPNTRDKKKEYQNATSSTGYSVPTVKKNNYAKKVNEMYNRIDGVLGEVSGLTEGAMRDVTVKRYNAGLGVYLNSEEAKIIFSELWEKQGHLTHDKYKDLPMVAFKISNEEKLKAFLDRKNLSADWISTENVNEARYSDYKNDESMSSTKKINTSIKEVNRRLYEIDRMVTHAMKLKTETGLDSDVFWKSTRGKFAKISERMLKIGNKLREFNK